MMPPPVNFEPTRVPTVETDMDQFDASRVTFAYQMAAAPARPVQKIYAPKRTQTPVQAVQPPVPPPREPPPAAPVQLNVPDKVRAHCTSICTLRVVIYIIYRRWTVCEW